MISSPEAEIRARHLTTDVDCEADSDYGKRYEIVAPLSSQSGSSVMFRSICQIDAGTDVPRLITMYPE